MTDTATITPDVDDSPAPPPLAPLAPLAPLDEHQTAADLADEIRGLLDLAHDLRTPARLKELQAVAVDGRALIARMRGITPRSRVAALHALDNADRNLVAIERRIGAAIANAADRSPRADADADAFSRAAWAILDVRTKLFSVRERLNTRLKAARGKR